MESFLHHQSNIIRKGDVVILWTSKTEKVEVKMTTVGRDSIYKNQLGTFHHLSIIGKEYGSKIPSKQGSGYIYALKPSTNLHTDALDHRTQILYTPDISMVMLQLDLKPGSIVVESGTGSGSLSVALAKSVIEDGHLFTFEFNLMRAKKAKEEFSDLGLDKWVTVTHRDVISNGFNIDFDKGNEAEMKSKEEVQKSVCESGDLKGQADAVFMDLPNPWNAVHHAKEVLIHNGRVCSFSPCIEQVQKTCLQLSKQDFADIVTYECLTRKLGTEAKFYVDPIHDFDQQLSDLEAKGYQEFNSNKLIQEHLTDVQVQVNRRKRKQTNKIEETSNIEKMTKGHTGYLTFATCKKLE